MLPSGGVTFVPDETVAHVGAASSSFTLRCNGSPNQLTVTWATGSFTMSRVDSMGCGWDSAIDPEHPDAPINTLLLEGAGSLTLDKAKSAGTVELKLTDQGEPGTGRDTMAVVIRNAAGAVVLRVNEAKITSGNVQAHEAQGNGTNDNGNLNGPTGNTTNK